MKFFVDLLLCLLRQCDILESSAKPVELRRPIILGDAKLFLDGLHLFAQEKFTLAALNALLYLLVYAHLRLGYLDLILQQEQHLLQAIEYVGRLQDILELFFTRGS